MSHVESELLAYLDGELSPSDTRSVEAHLARCPACKAALVELESLSAGMAQTVPEIYESVHLPAEAEARIRSSLAAERARLSRTNSRPQGLAVLLAGLRGAFRPLSKAAIPLMALFLVVLSLNAARLPQQPGVQQTVVLGQNTLAPGSQAALRVVVRDSASNQPVANANVAVQLRQAGLAKALYSGSTDATGSAPVQFAVPADWQGSAELVVDAQSELGDDQVVTPILLQRSYRLLLSSDKPVYQPGETLHLRTLALGKVDGLPASGATIHFEIADPNGNQLFSDEVLASDYGIAAIDVPLPVDAVLGQYQLRATLGDTVSELSIVLGQAPLPKFLVEVLPDTPYTLVGDRLTGVVEASYFYGKPLAGAPVNLRLIGSRPGADLATEDQLVFTQELEGVTGDDGVFVFQFDLPALPADAFGEDDTILLALEASVVDSAGDSEFGWERTTLALQPILIDVIPEDGVLHTGIENILYILTSYPDGQPATASLQVQIGSGAGFDQATNDHGLAEIRFTPRNDAEGDRLVSVTATDSDGRVGRAIVALPLDQTTETLILRTDRALYEAGDTLAIETIATGSGEAVYVDVIKGGQTILATSSLVENGKATIGIDLAPELAGALELNAYQVSGSDSILRDSRAIVVDSPADIRVAISTDKAEYQPGDEAQVTVQTTKSGEAVESAVGLAVVNEAVYAQREYQPGFARAYFLLENALRDPGLAMAGSESTSANAEANASTRDAQQLTAKASWASYSGQDYSLAVSSSTESGSDDASLRRRQAFSQLSILIGLALILASLSVATIVVRGLRHTGVLGQAASRVLLTVIALTLAGAALLFLTQNLLEILPKHLTGAVLAVIGLLWLVLLMALLAYGLRARDHRIQYVALWLFAYAVLLALLAFAASQGATLASMWLMLLAGSFGLMLAALLLFGWGLRAEGAKAAGSAALMLALLVLPLVVALSSVDLGGSDVIKKIAGPSVYGLNSGLLVGCAAPSSAPQAADQSMARQQLDQKEPAPAAELDSGTGAAVATVVGEDQQEATPAEAGQTDAELAAPAPAAEQPPAAPAAAESSSQPEPSPQPEAAAEAVALSAAENTTATAKIPAEDLATAQEITAPLAMAAAIITESNSAASIAAGASLTTSMPTGDGAVELRIPMTTTSTVSATLTLTPTLNGEAEARKVATASETTVATATIQREEPQTAASAVPSPSPSSANPTATASPVPATPTPTPEPTVAASTPLPPPAPSTDTPLAAPATAPAPAAEPGRAATPTPQVRIRQLPRPTSAPLEALPIIRERFPQTLYWNPEAITDADGRVQVTIPTGDAITSWRIAAQAVSRDGKLGSSSASLVVFQPLFLAASVPTDLSVGQEAAGQVQIFNYSSEAQAVALSAQSTVGLLVSPSESHVTVGANDVVSIPVLVRALQAGAQTATWVAVGDTAQDTRQVKITVK